MSCYDPLGIAYKLDDSVARQAAEAQQNLQHERYQLLEAAALRQYSITVDPDGPGNRLIAIGATVLRVLWLEGDEIDAALARAESNQNCREGGVLYLTGEGVFWCIVERWHQRGCEVKKEKPSIEAILGDVRAKRDKSSVPCMFFSTPFGCLQMQIGRECPFRHMHEHRLRCRNLVFTERLERLGGFTLRERQQFARRAMRRMEILIGRCPTEEEIDAHVELYIHLARCFCGYCEKPEVPGRAVFRQCKKCRRVWYCSSACQRADWWRHWKACTPWEKFVYRE
ncbi:uncharacterized protein VTP21DRAFT_6782 [Calcarisporiella thermophila]|uniref:uncharacterized protein n=1 Tax=Calcarisporiella thermophila TaxID=911321 RepID=UPI00374429C2